MSASSQSLKQASQSSLYSDAKKKSVEQHQQAKQKRRKAQLSAKRRKIVYSDIPTTLSLTASLHQSSKGFVSRESAQQPAMLTPAEFDAQVALLREASQPLRQREALKRLRRFLSLGNAAEDGIVAVAAGAMDLSGGAASMDASAGTHQPAATDAHAAALLGGNPDWTQYPGINQDLVELLGTHLRFANEENQLEASWCLTNLASGSHEVARWVMPWSVYLTHYLRSSNSILCEQCCWCLGNLAADCIEFRRSLIQMGVVPCLLDLLATTKVVSLRETSLWCLVNLVRGLDADVLDPLIRQYAILAGISKLLVSSTERYLGVSSSSGQPSSSAASSSSSSSHQAEASAETNRGILVEVCSLLVYFTSVKAEQTFAVVAQQLESVELVNALLQLVCAVPPQHLAAEHYAVLSPAIRTLGNLLRSDRFEQPVLCVEANAQRLYARLQQLLQLHLGAGAGGVLEAAESAAATGLPVAEEAAFQKELLWILSNICGSSNDAVIQQFVQRGFHEFILQLVSTRPLRAAVKADVLYMLTNLCSSEPLVQHVILRDSSARLLRFVNDLLSGGAPAAHKAREQTAHALNFLDFLCELFATSADQDGTTSTTGSNGNMFMVHQESSQIVQLMLAVGLQATLENLATALLNSGNGAGRGISSDDHIFRQAQHLLDRYLVAE